MQTTRTWATLLAVAVGLVIAGGCDDADDPSAGLVEALPDAALFALSLPGEDDGEVGPRVAAPLDVGRTPLRLWVLGARARATAGMARMLTHINAMVALKPTLQRPGLAVWRAEAGVPDHVYALVLAKDEDTGRVRVGLWVRAEPAGGQHGPWRFVLGGNVFGGVTRRGTLHINFDHDLRPASRGRVAVAWSDGPGAGGRVRTMDIAFHDARPDDDGGVDAVTRTFRYESGPDGGAFSFDGGFADIHRSPAKDGLERVRGRVFWGADGVLAATFAATGPEVAADGWRAVVGGQCWRAPDPTPLFEEMVALLADGDGRRELMSEGDRASCPAVVDVLPVVPEAGAPPADVAPVAELDALP